MSCLFTEMDLTIIIFYLFGLFPSLRTFIFFPLKALFFVASNIITTVHDYV